MLIGELCNRNVIYCKAKTSVLEAAQLMRNQHVGDLVVVDEPNGERLPVGLVTDRDLVVEIMAKELDPSSVTVSDIMVSRLSTATEAEGVYETIERMRRDGVRRMPVINGLGGLVGIITVDDLTGYLADELNELSRVSTRQRVREKRDRR
jgi:CBS domain-containing protein